MKQFLKKDELQLVNGGYLSNKEEKPVNNYEFVQAQRTAEYIITFAGLAKDKDFKGTKADSISEVRAEAMKMVDRSRAVEFVSKPKEVKRPTIDKLADEAMAFMDFQKDSSRIDKVNNFLQQFAILKEFEEFGLFFEEDIVKLNKIYTLKEVVDAVNETIDLLD